MLTTIPGRQVWRYDPGSDCPDTLCCLGDTGVLDRRRLGLICSVKCPGSVILQTYDFMRSIRTEDITVISGFHSPMERECLNILLRGTCGVAVCPARSIPKRFPAEYRKPIDDGRMLLISGFTEKQNRATSETSVQRNRLVAALSDVIFVPYAAAGGKTEALCKELIGSGADILTLPDTHSSNLTALGAVAVGVHGIIMLTKG